MWCYYIQNNYYYYYYYKSYVTSVLSQQLIRLRPFRAPVPRRCLFANGSAPTPLILYTSSALCPFFILSSALN